MTSKDAERKKLRAALEWQLPGVVDKKKWSQLKGTDMKVHDEEGPADLTHSLGDDVHVN